MNIALYGPGRAGGALVIAASRAGHTITSIDGRNADGVEALVQLVDVKGGEPEILILAVADDAIASMSDIVDLATLPFGVVHMSGAVPTSALEPFERAGATVGSFHPLQTLPSALVGANRLPGAHVAITAPDDLAVMLESLATSIRCVPFRISDDKKALYHAGAAAAANFTMTSLGIAHRLFEAAGVDPVASRPLVEAIVANAFDIGPTSALTGPIARGDVATVRAQVEAVRTDTPDVLEAFLAMSRATASFAGRSDDFVEVFE
jgi:predicted short-subunit dehydrogenase-like oxidoreductase (DUF2520 family)